MSFYLFLLSAEGLLSMMREASRRGMIQGTAAARRGPKVANLFFADDSLIFCRAKKRDCREVKKILVVYKSGLGHEVNVSKSGIFFSKNTREDDRNKAKEILEIQKMMD